MYITYKTALGYQYITKNTHRYVFFILFYGSCFFLFYYMCIAKLYAARWFKYTDKRVGREMGALKTQQARNPSLLAAKGTHTSGEETC